MSIFASASQIVVPILMILMINYIEDPEYSIAEIVWQSLLTLFIKLFVCIF